MIEDVVGNHSCKGVELRAALDVRVTVPPLLDALAPFAEQLRIGTEVGEAIVGTQRATHTTQSALNVKAVISIVV